MDGNYIAMLVTLVVWLGLFLYIIRVDGRIKKIERRRQ